MIQTRALSKWFCLSFVLCSFVLHGCARKIQQELTFNPAEPIRVAILPFAYVNKEGKIVESDADLFIDNIPGVSSKLKESPQEYVQKLVHRELSKSSLDIVLPALVSAQLSHNGFTKSDLTLNADKIFSADPKELCQKILQCDALLYGKITRWERGYYGVQTVQTVGIELTLISATDKKALYRGAVEDSDSRGLTKGPTGFSDLVIAPISGLDSKIILELTEEVVSELTKPLLAKSRPEFLQSAPPAIFAASSDATNGMITSDYLTVLLLGSPNKTASFSLGREIENIPMEEKDPGHYIGEFYRLPTDRFNDLPVFVSLTDEYGRATKRQVGYKTLSLSR